MAVNKPTFKVNVGANKKATERKTVFYDLKPDTSTRMRILPPVTDDGLIFAKVTNHFRLKNEEGFGMALACLQEHGTAETGETCYLCQIVNHLRKGDKGDQKIAGDLRPSPRWYVQAYILDKDSGEYFGPKLVGLSKTTAEALQDILVSQDDTGDDFFCDPEKGQDIVIKRTGSGLNTKYTVMPMGDKVPLSSIVPGWEDKIITDIYGVLDLRLEDMDGQKRALARTFEDELDWDTIQEVVG